MRALYILSAFLAIVASISPAVLATDCTQVTNAKKCNKLAGCTWAKASKQCVVVPTKAPTLAPECEQLGSKTKCLNGRSARTPCKWFNNSCHANTDAPTKAPTSSPTKFPTVSPTSSPTVADRQDVCLCTPQGFLDSNSCTCAGRSNKEACTGSSKGSRWCDWVPKDTKCICKSRNGDQEGCNCGWRKSRNSCVETGWCVWYESLNDYRVNP